jgi:acetyl esterase
MPVDPVVQQILDEVAKLNAPSFEDMTPEQARAIPRITVGQPEDVARVEDRTVPGADGALTVRVYQPSGDAPFPLLVYFHGGGWVIGDLDTHDTLCRELANGAGCAVVAVDYALGPEQRFPAAVDDCVAATRWVHSHAHELQLDATRLAVGGDSAGGNLAAVVSIAARDAGDLPIVYQLLIYPATDQHRDAPSHTANGQGYLLTSDTMNYFTGHYIADPAQYKDWRSSPLLHSDLAALPPALVLTAGYDPLRDEGAAYADRLTAAGNRTSYVCFERQIHGFILMGKVLDEANTAVALCAADLKRAFATTP